MNRRFTPVNAAYEGTLLLYLLEKKQMTSRRDFLEKLAVSAIGLPFLSFTTAACAERSSGVADGQVLRVAIMGLGGYGTRVAKAMESCTRAKLVGVISGTPSKIKTWQARYNIPDKNCYNYENFDNIKKQSRYRRGICYHSKRLTQRAIDPRCESGQACYL